MKQFKFMSRSALSFAVNAHGRQTYINFSPAYRGLSYFITTDEVLASRIRAHRWFREGRITESTEEVLPPRESRPYVQPPIPEKKKYTILGKAMATPKSPQPQQKEQPVVKEDLTTAQTEEQRNPQSFLAEDVTTFMEAKEFFITNYGLQRSDVSTKDAVAELCKMYNVIFPNYPL